MVIDIPFMVDRQRCRLQNGEKVKPFKFVSYRAMLREVKK